MSRFFMLIGFWAVLHLGSVAAKFNGISGGASIGGNIASLKGGNLADTLKQWGANGKAYLGVGKTLADIVFLGVEGFCEYNFLAQDQEKEGNFLENSFQFGGYVRAGVCPSENILVYGVFGTQTNTSKVKEVVRNLMSESHSGWSSMVGAGIEYSLAMGTVLRLEGVYISGQCFELKDVQNLKFESDFVTINLGIMFYL